MKWSILICTITERAARFRVLKAELERQIKLAGYVLNKDIEILFEEDQRQMSIGKKRNLLLGRATGEYLNFFDDDDWPDGEYIVKVMQAIEKTPDCVMMIGVLSTNGGNYKRFEHSINTTSYEKRNEIYYRPPNHLNPIKASIAKQFKFPEVDFSEDTDWAMQIVRSGLLKVEERIDKVIYHYRFQTQK